MFNWKIFSQDRSPCFLFHLPCRGLTFVTSASPLGGPRESCHRLPGVGTRGEVKEGQPRASCPQRVEDGVDGGGGEAPGDGARPLGTGRAVDGAVSADLALQTWACPHTSRHSWPAGSPWGTAAARGTPASAALRTQVSPSPVALPQCLPAGSWWGEGRLPGCGGARVKGLGVQSQLFSISVPQFPPLCSGDLGSCSLCHAGLL